MKPRDEGVPVHGHVRKFKEALHAAAGDATGKKRKKGGGEEVAVDPAEAIRQAMAASKARGGGSLGGGAWRDDSVARPTAAGRVALGKSGDAVVGAVNDRIGVASEEEIHDILRHFRSKDYLKLLGLPGAPVDRYGKVEWQTHVVNRPGEIAVKSKVMSLRVEPSRNKHPQAAEAYAAVNEAARTLQDKEGKKSILTLAVQRRVDEMRRKGEGDVQGGYVSMTGVHYAAGAAASQVANYKGEDDGAHGPAMNPGASLKPPTSALNAMARGGDDDAAREAAAVARERLVRANANTGGGGGGKQAAPKVDLGSIRDKLKKKKPSFM